MEIDERLKIDIKDFSQEEVDMLTSIRRMFSHSPEWKQFTALVTENVRNGLLSIKDAMKEINHIDIQEIGKDTIEQDKYIITFTNTKTNLKLDMYLDSKNIKK